MLGLLISLFKEQTLMILPRPRLIMCDNDGLADDERTGQVHLDDLTPLILGKLLKRMTTLDAGVIDQDVDGTDVLLDRLDPGNNRSADP